MNKNKIKELAEQAGYEKDMFGIGRKMESDISDVISL
jgi:nicotinic acid phosphoribosyltransferase